MKEIDFIKNVLKEAEEISKRNFSVKAKGSEFDLVTNLDLEIEKFILIR